MPIIKLTILAEDILTTNYFQTRDCAITRALHRNGFNEWRDTGTSIVDNDSRTIVDNNNVLYREMTREVVQMYRGNIEVTNRNYIIKY